MCRGFVADLGVESLLDRLSLGIGRLVVGIDLCGLGVSVTHPVLNRTQRNAGGSHTGAESVPELVKRHPPDFRALKSILEPTDELGAVKRLSALWMGEHKLAVGAVERVLAKHREGVRHALGHWNRSSRALRLRVVELAPYVGCYDPDSPCVEIDISPSQSEQLALP